MFTARYGLGVCITEMEYVKIQDTQFASLKGLSDFLRACCACGRHSM